MPSDPFAVPPGPSAPVVLLEVAHVAHRLRVGEDHVYQLIKARQLAVYRFGRRLRVDERELVRFMEAAHVPRDDARDR